MPIFRADLNSTVCEEADGQTLKSLATDTKETLADEDKLTVTYCLPYTLSSQELKKMKCTFIYSFKI
jgi:hypothetical protein